MRFKVLAPDEDPYNPKLPWQFLGMDPWTIAIIVGVVVIMFIFWPRPNKAQAQQQPTTTASALAISATVGTITPSITPTQSRTPTRTGRPTMTRMAPTQTPWIKVQQIQVQVPVDKVVTRVVPGPAAEVTRLVVEVVTTTPDASLPTATPWVIVVTQEVTREITVVVTPTETPTITPTPTSTATETATTEYYPAP